MKKKNDPTQELTVQKKNTRKAKRQRKKKEAKNKITATKLIE